MSSSSSPSATPRRPRREFRLPMCRRSSARRQPPPIARTGGLSYMSFDRDGDAGTAAALADALAQIAEGEGHRVFDMIDKAPPARSRPDGARVFATVTGAWTTSARTASRP